MIKESERIARPNAARGIWTWWKRVGRKIGDFQARVLLTFFYFVVIAPFALAIRWRSDPLAIKPGTPRGWRPLADKEGTSMEQATKQF